MAIKLITKGGKGGGGGGAVASVNGQTGVVVLTNTDVGADASGAAATVQGNLSTHAGLTTTAHGGIVASTDTRLTDARTPTAHAASHASAGPDAITIAESQVTNLTTDLAGKQATLTSGSNIKTINTGSILGSGNISLQTPLTAGTDYLTPTGSGASLTNITASQVGAEPANANIQSHISSTSNPHSTTASQVGAEPALGNPAGNGYHLASTTAGVRSWVPDTDVALSDSNPVMAGTAAPGTGTTASRTDHVHPTDTSRLATSGGTLTHYKETLYAATTSGNTTLDLANGNVQRITLDADRQIIMPTAAGAYGESFVLIVNCAGHALTWGSSPTIAWFGTSSGTTPPTLNATSGKSNILTFVWENANSRWLGWLAGKEA